MTFYVPISGGIALLLVGVIPVRPFKGLTSRAIRP